MNNTKKIRACKHSLAALTILLNAPSTEDASVMGCDAVSLGCKSCGTKDNGVFTFRIKVFSPLGLLNLMMKHYSPSECCKLQSQ